MFCISTIKLLKKLQKFNQVIIIMKIYIDNYKNLIILAPSKTIRANLPMKISESLEYDIEFIVSCNKSLVGYKI